MKMALKAVVGALAAVGGYAVVKYSTATYHEQVAVSNAEQVFTDLQTQGAAKHPELTLAEASQKQAVEVTAKKLAAATDPRQRESFAASTFFGFYFVNVRDRAEVCREHGVDIARFVTAFEKAHIKELAQARTIQPNRNEEDRVYALIKPQLRKAAIQDMSDMASLYKVSVGEACEVVAENGPELAKAIHISKQMPAVYQSLSGRI